MMKRQLYFAGAFFLFLATVTTGIELGEDGGYRLVVSIDPDYIYEPSMGADAYVQNIIDNYKSLSLLMYKATDELFWISDVEVIVPNTWELDREYNAASQLYSTADIRVSSKVVEPTVENPNLCSLPGDFIELPASFHLQHNSGNYGDNVKTLLTLWARYRWGAHDEHGYPGNARFPYFVGASNPAENDPRWIPTGCSNKPLKGTYETTNGTACDAMDTNMPDRSCRFKPNRSGNDDVTSSLMYLHWMESVSHFCNEDTHLKNATNKQNLFCDGKSVMETIRSSLDYTSLNLEAKNSSLGQTTFSVSKMITAHPALLILLDRGDMTDTEAGVINAATHKIGQWIADLQVSEDTHAWLGAFPTSETDPDTNELLPLGLFANRKDDFIREIGSVSRPVGPGDFTHALNGLARTVELPRGAAILLVKAGKATNTSLNEIELENTLRSNGIPLFSIEAAGVNGMNGNLARLASVTNGQSIAAASVMDVENNIDDLLSNLETVISSYAASRTVARPTALDSRVEGGKTYNIDLPLGSNDVAIRLTSSEKIDAESIIVSTSEIDDAGNFTEESQYGIPAGESGSVYVYSAVITVEEQNPTTIMMKYVGGEAQLTVTATGSSVVKDIDVSVTTTAVDGQVDLAKVVNPYTPFGIYVKVTQGGAPVSGALVVAHLTYTDAAGNKQTRNVTLVDDGSGSADIIEGDGIYSQILVPSDGDYSFDVTVMPSSKPAAIKEGFSGSMRLLPPGQELPEEPETLPLRGITKTVPYSQSFSVSNRANYKSVIQRIRGLRVVAPENGTEVEFEFERPSILGLDTTPTVYRFFRAASIDQLLALNLDAPLLPTVANPFNITENGAEAGSVVRRNQTVPRDNQLYYAVAAYDGDSHNLLSNIVDISKVSNPGPGPGPDPNPGEDENDGEWLTSTTGIIVVCVVVLACFLAAGVGYRFVMQKRAKKAAGTRFVRPGESA